MSGRNTIPACRHCNKALGQQAEKALSGEVQMVWSSLTDDEWVCDVTGDEHCPTHVPCEHGPEVKVYAGQWIIVEGNPVDGFVFHGIPAFTEHEDATAWAEENCTVEWWVVPLQDVE